MTFCAVQYDRSVVDIPLLHQECDVDEDETCDTDGSEPSCDKEVVPSVGCSNDTGVFQNSHFTLITIPSVMFGKYTLYVSPSIVQSIVLKNKIAAARFK